MGALPHLKKHMQAFGRPASQTRQPNLESWIGRKGLGISHWKLPSPNGQSRNPVGTRHLKNGRHKRERSLATKISHLQSLIRDPCCVTLGRVCWPGEFQLKRRWADGRVTWAVAVHGMRGLLARKLGTRSRDAVQHDDPRRMHRIQGCASAGAGFDRDAKSMRVCACVCVCVCERVCDACWVGRDET